MFALWLSLNHIQIKYRIQLKKRVTYNLSTLSLVANPRQQNITKQLHDGLFTKIDVVILKLQPFLNKYNYNYCKCLTKSSQYTTRVLSTNDESHN
jgi:hypothetical protein